MAMNSGELGYVQLTLTCPYCEQKQIVHVRASVGSGVMNQASLICVRCKKQFPIMVPDKVIGGPYPA
jgi:DNA-directed RNA polymerase subunit RPC12/RpoP